MKTTKNKKSVAKFLGGIKDDQRRKDAKEVLKIMKEVTKAKPSMWGDSIVGFGGYQYSRRDGSRHDFFVVGFSPRKANLTLYIMPGFKKYKDLMKKIGPHKTSVSCLYIKKLSDIDIPTLKKLIKESVKQMKKNHETTGI